MSFHKGLLKEDFNKKHSEYNAIISLLCIDLLEYQFCFKELFDQKPNTQL